ncbi:serine hydrolase domain-containing protein [Agaribacter flavus]|uniref:Serine hydrolase domain-containing protein n=1 Tax=Agaribacter flavus TaxID=1902781 RepID=A0ABV7FMT1_9ALTE
MKNFLTIICVLSSVSISHAVRAQNAEPSLHPDVKNIINVWIESQMDYEKIPFVSASYTRKQQTLWSGNYGKAAVGHEQPVTDQAISSICSSSKVFTATAIMKLVDEGKLSLDQKVKDLLPRFSIQGDDVDAITVRSLLTHTSGLPRDTKHSYWSGPNHDFPAEDDFYKSLTQQKMAHRFDTKVEYSNIGFALLGQIIQIVSEKSYKDYMESEIFEPLGMTHSVVELPKNQYGNEHVIGYSAINRDGKRQPANFYQTRAMQPAAGISSNGADLAKYAKWHFREIDASTPELMSSSSLMQMYQTDHSSVESNRGLGFIVNQDKQGDTWAMHGGMCPGYNSFLKLNLTKKEGFAFNTSANKVRAIAYINNLNKIIARGDEIDDTSIDGLNLSQYEGFYDLNPFNSEYYIGKWGSGLVLLYLPADTIDYAMYQYAHVDKDIFSLIQNGELTDEKIKFQRDKQGKVVAVMNDGGLHRKL